jgi:hypothetical protein
MLSKSLEYTPSYIYVHLCWLNAHYLKCLGREVFQISDFGIFAYT